MRGRRRYTSLIISMLFLLAAAATTLVAYDFMVWQENTTWLIVLAVACVTPIVRAWLSGSFDLFEPVYPVIVATFIYFVLMTPVLVSSDSLYMLGIDYRSNVGMALFLALLALGSFYIGYYGRACDACGRPRTGELTATSRAYARRWSWAMMGLFGSLFALWIIVGRVPLWSLWIFGPASYGSWQIEAQGAHVGHLYAALEALPACILLIVATRSTRHWPLCALILLGATTLLFAGIGVRARVLLVLGSAVALFYLERNKRPSWQQIVVMVFVVFYAIAGVIGFFRVTGDRVIGQQAFGLIDAWREFVAGSNILVTTAAYVRWVPEFGHDWGREFLRILLTPIPSLVWPDKYQALGISPISLVKAPGAAAAFFIQFYASFGPIGVVLGMALIGWLCRGVYMRYQFDPRSPFAQIYLALLWAYLFHVYGRDTVTVVFYGVLYVFAPVWIVNWLVSRASRHRTSEDRIPAPA